MTWLQALIGVGVGFVSGVLSGLFGVGGGIVMTPGIQVLMGAPPIVALATPLPVILPTAVTGALRYHGAHELDLRATGWMASLGLAGAAVGAALTKVVPTHLLLVVTAALLAWQSIGIFRGASRAGGEARFRASATTFAGIGLIAGVVSGLLGIGGGIVMVPMLAGWLGMPLKRVLGTSLATIVVLVIPGTMVHAALGHIDWAIFLVVVIGAVPGARIGANLALGARERTLRTWVGSFMLLVALLYGVNELMALLRR
ncbi:MAG: sulfite exporter TauE/SafE family protein [Planctomycetaceae bacterium]